MLKFNAMQQSPGDILRIAREKKKYKQQDIADKIGISLRQYNKYESGAFPKYKSDSIKAIDSLLGTSLYELLYEQKGREDIVEFKNDVKHAQELTKSIKQLEATVYVLKVTVAQLAATSAKKEIGTVLVELDQAIREKANSLFDEDKKNQDGF